MRNCVNCKHESKCIITLETKEAQTKGLRMQLLSPYKEKHLSESWRAITGGLARTCKDYEYSFSDELKKMLEVPLLKDYLDSMILRLKNNSEFVEEMLSDSFPEYKIEVINEYIEDLINDGDKDVEEHWESILTYVNQQFGF